MQGKPPRFFDGNAQAFTGLHFHLDDEVFEFYASLKMGDNPLWVNVTELMQQGVGPVIGRLYQNPALAPKMVTYISASLRSRESRASTCTSRRSQAARIRRSMSSSTSLTTSTAAGREALQGDLALAKVCAEWPGPPGIEGDTWALEQGQLLVQA
ncbi:MAG: hypothetical protein U0841_26880 [Chloroflexia bacterium]